MKNGVVKKAKRAIVKVVDQNNDGEFNSQDVAEIAGSIGNAAKKTYDKVKKFIDKTSDEMDKKQLMPIFQNDLLDGDFSLPKLVRVAKKDKKHAAADICKGSIGHLIPQKNINVLIIYPGKAKDFGITLSPDAHSEVYYVDPSDKTRYIALDSYFNDLTERRVNELQTVALALGAKYFKVTYKEEKATLTKKGVKAKARVNADEDSLSAEVQHDVSAKDLQQIGIAAEMECVGHEPRKPELHYLLGDSNTESLIKNRIVEGSSLKHWKYLIRLSNSSGIKEKDAANIDAALKAMKLEGNTTVTSEEQNERRRYLEYEIDF